MYDRFASYTELQGFGGNLIRDFSHHEIDGNLLLANQRWMGDPIFAEKSGEVVQVFLSIHFDDLHRVGSHVFRIHALVQGDDENAGLKEINPADVRDLYPGLSHLFRWQCMTPDGPLKQFMEWQDVLCFDGSVVPHKIRPSFASFLKSRTVEAGDGMLRLDTAKEPLERKQMPCRETALAEAWLQGLQNSRFSISQIPLDYDQERMRLLRRLYDWSNWPSVSEEEWEHQKPQLLKEFRRDIEDLGFWWDVKDMKKDPHAPWNTEVAVVSANEPPDLPK